MGIVYLLHFQPAYKHARHYLGFTSYRDVSIRLQRHQSGRGATLTRVAVEAGVELLLVRTWTGTRQLERRLKRWHGSTKLCPLCHTIAKGVKCQTLKSQPSSPCSKG